MTTSNEPKIDDMDNLSHPELVTNISVARNEIKSWKEGFMGRREELADQLKKNIGIKIDRAQYEIWKNVGNVEYLHIYMGLEMPSEEPVFYLVDNLSDQNEAYSNTLYKTSMTVLRTIDFDDLTNNETLSYTPEQEVILGTNKALRWLLFSNRWFREREEDTFVCVFRMSFESVRAVFETAVHGENTERALLFFAISDYTDGEESYANEIDLRIMSLQKNQEDNYSKFTTNTFRNITAPYPPFGITSANNFNLLS